MSRWAALSMRQRQNPSVSFVSVCPRPIPRFPPPHSSPSARIYLDPLDPRRFPVCLCLASAAPVSLPTSRDCLSGHKRANPTRTSSSQRVSQPSICPPVSLSCRPNSPQPAPPDVLLCTEPTRTGPVPSVQCPRSLLGRGSAVPLSMLDHRGFIRPT